MKSAAVREAWEFYRDNCPGFKEPMRRKFRELDEYVSHLEATLGRGTCKNKATTLRTFRCDCCDCALEDWLDVGGKLINGLRYCPNCGAKVVEE